MKRHPAVLARYVRERVPAPLLRSLFGRSPMEPDDLSLLITALQTSVQDGAMGPEQTAEYCQHLLRTHTVDTQLAMLSSSEKQALRELSAAAPQEVQGALRAAIG
ncbi:unnamed protein product [Prorocentrum cordatum]|uniref:RNA-polymerase II-associated protein 3-like C-terminal domain-containing protein n=1 Tax=Prorocentrum cordatum TaxID=2364126 RepID=A0ABN9QHH8_9DINO|nr:unnamed protein product [Polarella glacialis]